MAAKRGIFEMGSIVMDHTMYVDRLPTVGQSLMTDNFHRFPGGKGSNQAITAARFGGQVRFIGRIGTDATSCEMDGYLRREQVDMAGMIVDPDTTVGMAIVLVDKQGNNYVVFDPAATLRLTPQDIENSRQLFVPGDLLALTMEFERETVYAAIRMAHRQGMRVMLDPLAIPLSEFPADIPPMVEFIKPNETEASALTGIEVCDPDTARRAGEVLRQAGFARPIVSLGAQGILAWVDGQPVHLPAPAVSAIDSTGAGDVFIGAFCGELTQHGDLLQALRMAVAAAALSTTKMGAQTSIPRREDVLRALQEQ